MADDATEPTAPAKAAKVPKARAGKPPTLLVATYLMVAVGLGTLVTGFYLLATGSVLPFFLSLLLGGVYTLGGRGLLGGEDWGWGAGVFGGVLFLVLGPWFHLLLTIMVVLAAVVMVLLLLPATRDHLGLHKFDPEVEEREKANLRKARTTNPERLRCPHCAKETVWIASDGSAFCESCKSGTISIRPVKA